MFDINLARFVRATKWFGLALMGLAFFVACAPQPEIKGFAGKTMGTSYSVKFVSADPAHDPEQIKQHVDGLLAQINAQMSTYDPNSELSRFNESDQTTPYVVSRNLEVVVNRALEIARETDGVLDVTVGPLVNLWGFGPQARPTTVPSADALAAIREYVGYELLQVSNHQLTKAHPDVYVDLSTIAKGYGVDRVARVLEQLDIHHYLVEIGGELRLKGSKPNDEPWRVAIEKPISGERSVQEILEPGNMALATSGDYRNFYVEDGVRYSHIIDPRTGMPIQHHLVSVTVLAPTCMDADAYATALTVMGPDAALAFAEQKQLPVLLVVREGEQFVERASSWMEPYRVQ